MPILTTTSNKIIDHLVGKTSFTMPTTFLGLFTALPTIAGGGTEMTGGSYARTATAGDWNAAASGANTNSTAISVVGNAGTVVGWGIWDASSAGNLLLFGPLQQVAASEAVTLSGGLANVANAGAGISNVVVKNNTDSTTYVEGTDYYIEYNEGTVIRIASGAITASQALHVTYQYPLTRTILNGDNINFTSGQLGFAVKGWE